jgi:hypothetical protein
MTVKRGETTGEFCKYTPDSHFKFVHGATHHLESERCCQLLETKGIAEPTRRQVPT